MCVWGVIVAWTDISLLQLVAGPTFCHFFVVAAKKKCTMIKDNLNPTPQQRNTNKQLYC